MSREIKFRAWVRFKSVNDDLEIQKKWYKGIVTSIHLDRSIVEVDLGFHGLFPLTLDSENLVLEQYTGMKDVHGVEIYDGDIVEFEENSKRIDENFLGWGIGIIRQASNGAWCISDGPKALNVLRMTESKIVGNIHENTNLLEVGTDE